MGLNHVQRKKDLLLASRFNRNQNHANTGEHTVNDSDRLG
jgi:hypothetical protein